MPFIKINFRIGSTIVTWWIDGRWISYFTFFSSFILSLALTSRFLAKRKRNKTDKVLDVKKGGVNFLDVGDCIERDTVYEVVDPELALAIRRMLGEKDLTQNPIIVSTAVGILGDIISKEAVLDKALAIVVYEYIKLGKHVAMSTASGLTLGSAAAIGLNYVGAIGLLPTIGSTITIGVLAAYVTFSSINQNPLCNNIVNPISKLIVRERDKQTTRYIEQTPQQLANKVLIDGGVVDKESSDPIVTYRNNVKEECTVNFETTNPHVNSFSNPFADSAKPVNEITTTCTKKSDLPLRERTRTWDDLKKLDSSDSRREAQSKIDRYKRRRQQIKERAGRIRNTDNTDNK